MRLQINADTVSYVSTDGKDVVVASYDSDVISSLKDLITSGTITDESVRTLLRIGEAESIKSNVYFIRRGNALFLREVPQITIPSHLADKMYPRPSESLINFWKLAALNPNPTARDGLFWFLDTHDFEITPEGYFVAYRNVNTTNELGVYTDNHTGTFKIRIGESVSIDRGKCDDDPNVTCSAGLHVASKTWLTDNYYGDTGLICLVNPMHVVAVPPQDSYGKMRVCEYLPVGTIRYENGRIASSTSIRDYPYNLDRITERQLNDMLRATNLQDGSAKTIFDTNLYVSDYVDMISSARDTVHNRLVEFESIEW